ncbi:HEM4 domain-containing protein, partial [Haematococcus lacustris]
DCTAERQALAAGQVHAIAFTSTAEAQGLVTALGGREVVAQAVAMHQVVLAAHGPYTAQGL